MRWRPKARRSSATPLRLPRSDLRGIFFGTSEFAVPSLRAFAASVHCVLAVTQPDRKSGRGHRVQPTPVKIAARELGIPTLEPDRLRAAVSDLRAAAPDLLAVASYGKIVPQSVLDLASHGALNVHPSLLPLYRGATPLQSQLRDGVTAGGVTIIAMDAGMDTGDIVMAEESEIGPEETYGELHDRLAARGAELLARACAAVVAGTVQRTPQAGRAPEAEVERTRTKPLEKADLILDWSQPARRIADRVRSLAPAPGARATLPGDDEPCKILDVRVSAAAPEHALAVAAGDGNFVVIERLVPPNRPAMAGAAYLAARRDRARTGAAT